VEKDPVAAATYALNFAREQKAQAAWSVARDMEDCSAGQLVQELGLDTPADAAFDVLAAGLPCQAFARIGRSKLREIAGGEEDAFRKDPRAALYLRFLEFVSDTQPLAIIIENVPDILNFGGHNVPEEICETLEDAGYVTSYTILNAAYYGVPQIRERVFLIALADDLGIAPKFPEPTHFLDLPKGYEGSRRVALKHVPPDSPRFVPIHTPSPELQEAVGVRQALADLPEITEHVSDPRVMRRRRLTHSLPYREIKPLSSYAELMRTWQRFQAPEATDGHLVRLTPRDFPIFAKMPFGADYPRARKIAEEMFATELERLGIADDDHNAPDYLKLRAAMVPPYDPMKFPNKWWKMDPLKPSRTLTAHMGKDTYSHIHYDNDQQRTVSVREAARLQSFPDGFRFSGEMNAAFRQIGNAVPPLLGLAVAQTLKGQLDHAIAAVEMTNDRQAA
jgi:DNA (cytosine-5)-methyltransferase 1